MSLKKRNFEVLGDQHCVMYAFGWQNNLEVTGEMLQLQGLVSEPFLQGVVGQMSGGREGVLPVFNAPPTQDLFARADTMRHVYTSYGIQGESGCFSRFLMFSKNSNGSNHCVSLLCDLGGREFVVCDSAAGEMPRSFKTIDDVFRAYRVFALYMVYGVGETRSLPTKAELAHLFEVGGEQLVVERFQPTIELAEKVDLPHIFETEPVNSFQEGSKGVKAEITHTHTPQNRGRRKK